MYIEQFDSVELRIGNNDMTGSPLGPFTENQWIGYLGQSLTVQSHTVSVEPQVSGRFLTLQTMVNQVMGIDEIYAKALV